MSLGGRIGAARLAPPALNKQALSSKEKPTSVGFFYFTEALTHIVVYNAP